MIARRRRAFLAACLLLTPLAAQAQSEPSVSVRGALIVGSEHFTASRTFQGIFNSSNGVIFGGGGEVGFARHLFVRVDVTHFSKTGQRAFSLNGQVFQLGIPLTVSITPVTGSFGFRGNASRQIVWYVGGGAGSWSYHESGPDAGDTFSTSATGYQALGGIEWRLQRFVGVGFEAQYASVPNAIGKGGLSKQLNETDLGGTTAALRIVVGR